MPFDIAPVSIDELSDVRYVHAAALKATGPEWADDDELAAFVNFIATPAYTDDLAGAVASGRLLGGRIDGRLAGTCGWSPVEDEDFAARIRWCNVLPMFAGHGLGTSLLATVEAHAAGWGARTLVARSTPNATGFFERAGFRITSQGTRPIGGDVLVPVTFLRKG